MTWSGTSTAAVTGQPGSPQACSPCETGHCSPSSPLPGSMIRNVLNVGLKTYNDNLELDHPGGLDAHTEALRSRCACGPAAEKRGPLAEAPSRPGALAGRRQERPRSCLCGSCARKMPVPKRANGCRQAQAAVFAAQLLAERVKQAMADVHSA